MNRTYEEHLAFDVIEILNNIKVRVDPDTDIVWTRFDSVEELIVLINSYIVRVTSGDTDVYKELKSEFLPTASFQDLSISNGWGEEFLDMAEQYDEIYRRVSG